MSGAVSGRPRQPGRTAQKYDPGNCGVCDKSIGNPPSTIALIISGTGSCCSLSLDADSAHAHQLTGSDGCVKGSTCSWEGTFTGGGLYIHMGVTLSCVGGVPTVSLSITRVDSSGNYIETLADGTFATTAYGTCDNCDCGQLMNHASGALTVYNTDVCNPTFCTSPSWSLGTSAAVPCPQPASFNCCCGGTPPPPCFFVCIHDPACGGDVEVPICRRSNSASYGGSAGGVSVAMDYDPSTGYTISYSCDGGGNSLTIGPGDPGWTRQNGAIHLSGSGSGFSLTVGKGPQCSTLGSCGPCAAGTFPTSTIFIDFGGGGLTNNTCHDCGAISGVYGLEGALGVATGCSVNNGCNAAYYDPHFSPNAGNCINEDSSPCSDWRLGIGAAVCPIDGGGWRWTASFYLDVAGNSFNSAQCGTCDPLGATYYGPPMSSGDSCDLSTPVDLVLTGYSPSSDPKIACLGSPPATVRLFS